MIFTSLKFLVFFALVFAVYFCIPKKFRWISLLICSGYFYLSAGVRYSLFLVFSIISAYVGARLIGAQENRLCESRVILSKDEFKKFKTTVDRRKKLFLAAVLLLNLGILGFLKYYGFALENFSRAMAIFGLALSPSALSLFLPLGISFYTFQITAYLIDIYRNTCAAERNIFKFALFVSFFPQITQGPIGRYDTLAPQLFKGHAFDYQRVTFGAQRMVWGFFEKLVIADRLALAVDFVWANHAAFSGAQVALAVIFFAFQIYADFSGYMDIALGAGEILGVKLAENFNTPYFSASIPEFWRRWHITLSSFFRDYLFYPVLRSGWCVKLKSLFKKAFGKSAAEKIAAVLALLIVWFLTGLWHGASWHYVAWGLYYGVLIILSMLFKPVFDYTTENLKFNRGNFFYKLLQIAKTFLLVCAGYVFFRSESMTKAFEIFKSIGHFSFSDMLSPDFLSIGLDRQDLYVALAALFILLIVNICRYNGIDPRKILASQWLFLRWTIYISIILAVVIFGIYGPGYDARSFIYFQF